MIFSTAMGRGFLQTDSQPSAAGIGCQGVECTSLTLHIFVTGHKHTYKSMSVSWKSLNLCRYLLITRMFQREYSFANRKLISHYNLSLNTCVLDDLKHGHILFCSKFLRN